MTTIFVDIALLAMLAVIATAVIRMRNLFGVVMLTGIYSLASAALLLTMDAPDVAFTEAAVGVGVSTVLMLAALSLVGHEEKPVKRPSFLPLAVVVVTGSILLYGTMDIPPFGDPSNPIHHHVTPRYLVDVQEEVDVPNAVAAVLASYRGYDTMGETTVIFAAGVGVLLMLSGRRRKRPGPDQAAPQEGTSTPSGDDGGAA